MTPRERIARALAEHVERLPEHSNVIGCSCGWESVSTGIYRPWPDFREHQAQEALAALTSDEAVQEWAAHLDRIHFDGQGCGDPHSPGACSNCFGPSPMTSREVAEALRAHLTGGAS